MAQIQYLSHDLTLSTSSVPPSSQFPAKIAYRIYGSASNPAILLPTCYCGKLESTLPFLYLTKDGSDPVLSSKKYFIIVCGLLGGSESSSPSNTTPPFNGPNFPRVTYEDNMRLQHALCLHLGVKRLHAYIGFSMGSQQAYHFASVFPDFVDRIIAIAGSARTSAHNWSFLEGPKAALVNSVDYNDGNYTSAAVHGTRAFGRVYSTWALSQQWFREKCWEKVGYSSLAEYLTGDWERGMESWDANDLLCLLWTWQNGDISIYHAEDNKELPKALERITAKALIMPTRTDMYFPPEDSMEEVKYLKRGELVIIESIWGHLAGGGGGTPEDAKFIQHHVDRFVN